MRFAPLLDPLHVLGVVEVISTAWFSQPAPLTGGFACLATIRSRTEKLTTGIMNIGSEKHFAAAALASVVLGTHRLPSGKKTGPSDQSKTSPGSREKVKKEENFSRRILKKIRGKKN
jgi:hypothetical protein